MKNLAHDPMLGHITTFGGSPLSCAAGKAALEVLIASGWMSSVNELGEIITNTLMDHPKVKSIKGMGLLISIFLDSPEVVLQIQKKLIERKIITNFFLFEDTALRITPPLCIKKKELKYFTSNLIQVLNEL